MGGHDMELSHHLSSLPHHQDIVKIYVPIMYCKGVILTMALHCVIAVNAMQRCSRPYYDLNSELFVQ